MGKIHACGTPYRSMISCNITESTHVDIGWKFLLLAKAEVDQILHLSSLQPDPTDLGVTPGDRAGPVNLALMTAVVPLICTIVSCSGVGGPLGNPT